MPMSWNQLLSDSRDRPSTSRISVGRTVFDLDYDRVLFSSPVRRLQDKAQVFPLERNDSVRTRLTHSLEVSTVARSMVRQAMESVVGDKSVKQSLKPTDRQIRELEVIAATCGLIHDLGNPPFGHAGEESIQDWFKKNESVFNRTMSQSHRDDFLHFEGNAQTFRLISHLQVQADKHGLNFTYGTLAVALKYVASATEARKERTRIRKRQEWKKPGYFCSERDVVARMRHSTGIGNSRHPITYLVEAADDAVYSACDLEDAIRKGVLTHSQTLDLLKERFPEKKLYRDFLKRMKRVMPQGDSPDAGTQATAVRIALHGMAIPELLSAFHDKFHQIMNGSFHGCLEENSPTVDVAKSIGVEQVYASGKNPELELFGRCVIQSLLTLFWEGIAEADQSGKKKSFPQKIMSLVSPNYANYMFSAIEADRKREQYYRLQLLTDFVCGMTDTFASDLHRRLFCG